MKKIFLFVALGSICFFETGLANEPPGWLWHESRDDVSEFDAEKNVAIKGKIQSALLRFTADFATLSVEINANKIAELEAYDPTTEMDVARFLKSGENKIRLIGEAVAGPSAMAARLDIDLANGEKISLKTDESWNEDAKNFGEVRPTRWGLNQLPELGPLAEYNQWKEAKTDTEEKLSPLPPGFEIERLRKAEPDEDSWVSMVIDSKGRVLIGKEQRGILRLTLPKNDGEEIAVEVVNDTLEECRGLAFAKNGDLFANANRIRGLFRLRDTTGDDEFDEVKLLRRTEGSVGHGRNDLVAGPDGRIHSIQGDVVDVPTDSQKKTVPEPGAPKELGYWSSTNVDGNGWTIHTRGLRNPYGIDFNHDDEPFTYDADNEGDVGLPFYRPTRINHLVSGANYGWHQDRNNTRNLTTYAPDSVPTTFDVGRGSPTGVKFCKGTSWPQHYWNSLFAFDWAYGRIISVWLTPRGASYHATGETFLEGRPLNVTDLEFAENGDMLFVTGGRKTQSALYRIRFTGHVAIWNSHGQEADRREFSERARERRRQLEQLHGNADAPDFSEARDALGDADPWIRNAARVALETQNAMDWAEISTFQKDTLGWLTSVLAVARRPSTSEKEISEIVRVLAQSSENWGRNEQLTALRIYEICHAKKSIAGNETVARQIEPWLTSLSDPVRREVVRILVAVESPAAVPAGLRLAAEADEQLGRLHFLEMLSEAKTGWTPDTRRAFFKALASAKHLSYGDRFKDAFFKTLESNVLDHLADEKLKTEFTTMLAEKEIELPEPEPRDFVKAWAMTDFSEADFSDEKFDAIDLNRGRKLFDAVLCSRCHVFGTHGRPIGPDLTTVARRFGRHDLLEAIIEPSKVVADVHKTVVIQKTDDTSVAGRIVQNDLRKSLLFISENPFTPTDLTEVKKADIKSTEPSPVSPMPPALLNTLSKAEIVDLLGWLESGNRN